MQVPQPMILIAAGGLGDWETIIWSLTLWCMTDESRCLKLGDLWMAGHTYWTISDIQWVLNRMW